MERVCAEQIIVVAAAASEMPYNRRLCGYQARISGGVSLKYCGDYFFLSSVRRTLPSVLGDRRVIFFFEVESSCFVRVYGQGAGFVNSEKQA